MNINLTKEETNLVKMILEEELQQIIELAETLEFDDKMELLSQAENMKTIIKKFE